MQVHLPQLGLGAKTKAKDHKDKSGVKGSPQHVAKGLSPQTGVEGISQNTNLTHTGGADAGAGAGDVDDTRWVRGASGESDEENNLTEKEVGVKTI